MLMNTSTLKRPKKDDTTSIDGLKQYLESIGIDFEMVDDLLADISADFTEVVANKFAENLLGPDWKAKMETFRQKVIGI